MHQVLIADDELRIRQGLKKLIGWGELGYEIAGEASNGEDAYRFMAETKPDVALIDIRMPKLTGMETIKKAKEGGFAGKIIILSGYSDFSYAQQAIGLGVQHYLTKPVNQEELKRILVEIKSQFQEEDRRRQ